MNSQNINCISIKKYIPVVIFILLTSSGIKAQTFSSDNFVSTAAPKKPVTSANYNTLTKDEINQSVTYFDGLGRPIQTIAIGQGGEGQNIITPMEYDGFGRQAKEYLPYPITNGSNSHPRIDPAQALADAEFFYNKQEYQYTTNAFSEKQFEPSPLNRIQKQAAPGASWKMGNGNEIKIEYKVNTAADGVKFLKANTSWQAALGLYEISFSIVGNYADKELYKTITYDENSGTILNESAGSTVEFKNKEGQIILKRTYDSGNPHDTYYVYDDYGNLTYVIPPKATDLIGTTTNTEANLTSRAKVAVGSALNLTASNSITLLPGFHAEAGSTFSAVISDGTQGVLEQLCYQYKYDNRNRLVEKKLPGKQWEFIVYDKLDRPVATGPAYSPFSDISGAGWIITKYDAFSRPVYTGWSDQTSTSATRKLLQDAQNAAGVLYERKQNLGTIDGIVVYYTNTVAPTSFKLLTVNYYDTYAYPNTPVTPSSVEGQPVLSNVKGLATGSWTRVLSSSGSTVGEIITTFYDPKSRPVRIYTQNYLGGYTYTDSKLDFIGKASHTITRHKRTSDSAELVTREEFTYSAQDRLLTHTHQINNGPVETIASNTYDDLGQLSSKEVGNSAQNINYSYNVRGWLTGINDVTSLTKPNAPKDLFAFQINYNTPTPGGVALYNGNISQTHWKTVNSESVLRNYNYSYDKLNRLTAADFRNNTNAAQNSSYFEKLQYDKNGNITFLHRSGDVVTQPNLEWMDYMIYSYQGNQLTRVKEEGNNYFGFITPIAQTNTANQYMYDLYGNMTADTNKNITAITYNHLNLPTQITFATTGNIVYIYNAAGQKLQKIVNRTGTAAVVTDYLGGYQYEKIGNQPVILKFFPTAEGYVEPVAGSYKYIYQYKDHLGNIRLSYDKNLAIQEESNYYPFGLKQEGYNIVKAGVENKYKYNGKELQEELGLNFYDYGARNYDAALGRWMNIDPLAEKMRRWSPYNYTFDNPMRFTDPDGMGPDDWIKKGNRVFYDATVKTQKDATAIYGDNAKIMSEGSKTLSTTNGQVDDRYSYTYHDNGTVTDKNNETVDFNNEDVHTEGGTTIVNPENKSGNFSGFSFGGAALGGISLEAGVVNDPSGGSALYFSYGANAGLGGGAGSKAGVITPTGDNPFSVSDFSGKGNAWSVAVNTPLGGAGVERGGSQGKDGFSDYGNNPRGYKYTAVPSTLGHYPSLRAGAVISETKTWTFTLN
ncbi:DUF6443 domain-containing protein [Flavobacterium sp.]|uniref:DUF6443 domain-containing protein n=1 Tax=Flavobacterium sp. TaxID=239 RepID=UPI0025BDBBA4|nr:DUF6443 domain-containing protein [Flavobacterium sp.]